MFPTTVDLKGRNRRTETLTGQCEIHHQSAATTANKTPGLGSEQTKNLTTGQNRFTEKCPTSSQVTTEMQFNFYLWLCSVTRNSGEKNIAVN